MMEKPHISPGRILDLLESREGISAEIRDHLQRCAACTERFHAFERLLSLLEIARIPEPDEALIHQAWERIRTEAGAAETRPSIAAGLADRLREVWATLATEPLVPSLAVRGGQVASPRMLVYETPRYAISLSIGREERESLLELRGRVIPRSEDALPAGGTVRLEATGATRAEPLGEFGSFLFERTPAGPLRLEIEIGGELVRLPRIEESTADEEG